MGLSLGRSAQEVGGGEGPSKGCLSLYSCGKDGETQAEEGNVANRAELEELFQQD